MRTILIAQVVALLAYTALTAESNKLPAQFVGDWCLDNPGDDKASSRPTGWVTSAVSRYLVPSCEEVAHTFKDVVVDTSEYRPMRPVGEVARPAKQKRVQRIAHSGQGSLLPGASRSPTFVLNRCTLFLDGLTPRYHWPFALYQ